jgi:hypothetical protein
MTGGRRLTPTCRGSSPGEGKRAVVQGWLDERKDDKRPLIAAAGAAQKAAVNSLPPAELAE